MVYDFCHQAGRWFKVNGSDFLKLFRLVVSATGFEGRLLEATSALLQLDPALTGQAELTLGEPQYWSIPSILRKAQSNPVLFFLGCL